MKHTDILWMDVGVQNSNKQIFFRIIDMICHGVHYSPTVLYGRQRVYGQHVETLAPQDGKGLYLSGIYRLVLVEEGKCRLQTPDGVFYVTKGQIALLQPNRLKDMTMAPQSHAKMIGFAVHSEGKWEHTKGLIHPRDWRRHEQPGAQEVWGVELPCVLDDKTNRQIYHDFRHIVATYWQDEWHHHLANHKLAWLLITIVKPHLKIEAHGPKKGEAWFDGVQELIEERLEWIQSTEDLASIYGRNTQAFSRVFQKEFGESPSVYLRRRRLERAMELIRSTQKPISLIAVELGYRSPAALNHAWNQHFSQTPRKWREEQMKG